MGKRNGHALAALSLAALASLTACVESEGTGDPDVGTVSIGLAGQGASGAVYRLRDATFTVTGPSSMMVWHTEDDPDRTSLSANVVVGNYTAALANGWRLERLVTGQPPVDVNATLVSPNPAAFAVNPMMRTAVPFRFEVDGGVVDMSQGYDITIDIDELTTSIVTMPSSLTLSEGASATIGVRLASAPPAPITVQILSNDATAVAAAPAMLLFTPANFAMPQPVTINALQDADTSNEMVSLALASPGLPTALVAIAVIDDDTAMQAVITTVSSMTLAEGTSAVIGVRLAAPPAGPVTIGIVSSDTSVATTSPTTLTFTPIDYATFQNVAVTAVQDVDVTNEMVALTFNAPGAPPLTIPVTVTDDDVQTIITSVANLAIVEGGTGTFTVRLAAQPPSNVTIQLTSSDPGAANVTPIALTFTPASFATPQQVTVVAPQDGDLNDEFVQIMLVSPGVPTATVTVDVVDNDA